MSAPAIKMWSYSTKAQNCTHELVFSYKNKKLNFMFKYKSPVSETRGGVINDLITRRQKPCTDILIFFFFWYCTIPKHTVLDLRPHWEWKIEEIIVKFGYLRWDERRWKARLAASSWWCSTGSWPIGNSWCWSSTRWYWWWCPRTRGLLRLCYTSPRTTRRRRR